jgi:hypothetical protein
VRTRTANTTLWALCTAIPIQAIDFVANDSQLAGNISAVWVVATVSWVVVAIAAAIELHRAGAGKAVVAMACVSTVFAAHVAPAAIGLLALVVAGVLRERQRTKSAVGLRPSPLEVHPARETSV